ncbi:hypothetical protein FA15DRAFT_694993 [Coprinopsis marcescibilis]|uniref:Uncharacterized protein n=1 Tax=Coprinopsis marcescibilis TaxID=230819 RepID=A0A5C3KT00_COPMA|nr:hypothetical protein FA15DRAFT_694993 [Coprinopsis marcescibilis]
MTIASMSIHVEEQFDEAHFIKIGHTPPHTRDTTSTYTPTCNSERRKTKGVSNSSTDNKESRMTQNPRNRDFLGQEGEHDVLDVNALAHNCVSYDVAVGVGDLIEAKIQSKAASARAWNIPTDYSSNRLGVPRQSLTPAGYRCRPTFRWQTARSTQGNRMVPSLSVYTSSGCFETTGLGGEGKASMALPWPDGLWKALIVEYTKYLNDSVTPTRKYIIHPPFLRVLPLRNILLIVWPTKNMDQPLPFRLFVDDASLDVHYSPVQAWTTIYGAYGYANTHHLSTDPDARAIFKFRGVSIEYHAPLWARTISTMLIFDGGSPETLNLSDPMIEPRPDGIVTTPSQVRWVFYNLDPATEHELVVQAPPIAGGQAIVDLFVVGTGDISSTSASSFVSRPHKTEIPPRTSPDWNNLSESESPTTRSRTTTISIAVGCSVAGLSVIIACLACFFLWRRKRQTENKRFQLRTIISPFDDIRALGIARRRLPCPLPRHPLKQALQATPPMRVVNLAPVIKRPEGDGSPGRPHPVSTNPRPRSTSMVESNVIVADQGALVRRHTDSGIRLPDTQIPARPMIDLPPEYTET